MEVELHFTGCGGEQRDGGNGHGTECPQCHGTVPTEHHKIKGLLSYIYQITGMYFWGAILGLEPGTPLCQTDGPSAKLHSQPWVRGLPDRNQAI